MRGHPVFSFWSRPKQFGALTPDQLFIDRPRLPHLHEYYLDGPPAVIVEVVQPGSEIQDRHHVRFPAGGVRGVAETNFPNRHRSNHLRRKSSFPSVRFRIGREGKANGPGERARKASKGQPLSLR
jgi:hypothetical protein